MIPRIVHFRAELQPIGFAPDAEGLLDGNIPIVYSRTGEDRGTAVAEVPAIRDTESNHKEPLSRIASTVTNTIWKMIDKNTAGLVGRAQGYGLSRGEHSDPADSPISQG